MPYRKSTSPPAQATLFDVSVKTAPCVPKIREAVAAWVEGKYKGATETTKTLLNHWFHTDHRLPNGQRFAYYPFQREAIQTLIYVNEVAGIRSHKN